jgi:hypothetical protein
MPPTIGAAMGFITSEPIPDSSESGQGSASRPLPSSGWGADVAPRFLLQPLRHEDIGAARPLAGGPAMGSHQVIRRFEEARTKRLNEEDRYNGAFRYSVRRLRVVADQ